MKELFYFNTVLLQRLKLSVSIYWEWGEIGAMLRLPTRNVSEFEVFVCLSFLNFRLNLDWGKR